MISPNDDPLTSRKLAASREDLAKQKARAAQSKSERLRLTKILHPQFAEATVRRYTGKEMALKANLYNKPNVTNAATEDEQAARKAEVLKRTLAGEPLQNPLDTKAKLEHEHRQSDAIEDAIEFLQREIERERSALAIQYCKKLEPKEAELVGKICKSLVELLAPWSELYALKRHLIDSEVGLRGLCLTLPDFLGAPTDKQSGMADFLRAAVEAGYLKELPRAYRA